MKLSFGWSLWFIPAVFLLIINIFVFHYVSRRNVLNSITVCDEVVTVHLHSLPTVNALNDTEFTYPFSELSLNSYHLSVLGLQRDTKGFLTVGIPSIHRINGPLYLLKTLKSLIDHTSAEDKSVITVIVFLADFNVSYNNDSANAILSNYQSYLDSGFIRVLSVSLDYYPQLEGLKRNFGDSPDRVKWRAKQVADFALLFAYSRNLSEYYVQIEDDVETAHRFADSIRRYISDQNRSGRWATLEFSELGFIGKLFRSSDLNRLAQFMWMFYAEQPVDWLMNYFRMSLGQQKILLRKPTLFQHFGSKSSFDTSKDNPLRDRFFDPGDGVWSNADNPPAVVLSTMSHFKDHVPEMAYSSGTGYFWATKSVVGDVVDVIFDTAQNLSSIIVLTGNKENPGDKLEMGSLYVSSEVVHRQKGGLFCPKAHKLMDFTNGQAVAENLEKRLNDLVHCITITVDVNHGHWILFARIAVFVVK